VGEAAAERQRFELVVHMWSARRRLLEVVQVGHLPGRNGCLLQTVLNCQIDENARIFAMTATSNLSHGRTVIPAALREQLGIKDGDQLIWEIRDGELVVTTRVAQLRRVQALINRHIPKSVSLVDQLITERRAEEAAEQAR